MTNVTTYLIDPNRLSREGLLRIFSDSAYQIVKDAADITELKAGLTEDSAPDLVLVDCGQDPDQVGPDLSQLRAWFPNAKIVALTGSHDPQLLMACFDAPINGCILKEVSSQALIESLNLILLGERIFPSELIGLLLRGNMNRQQPAAQLPANGPHLSEREVQILQCLVAGDSNKVIANRLKVTEATIKVHLKSILRKINVRNRTQAAIWALNHGMRSDEVETGGSH